MVIGYGRVSTLDQNLDLQIDALEKAGCEKIFTDKASGTKDDRPGLLEALDYARSGDVIVVWKLDRCSRSLSHLLSIVNSLHEKGIGFKSLQENIDTTSSSGKLIFHIFASLAEFERDLIRDRTKAGLAAARARGRLGGRPALLNGKKQELLKSLYQDKNNSIKDICEILNVSTATLYRKLKQI